MEEILGEIRRDKVKRVGYSGYVDITCSVKRDSIAYIIIVTPDINCKYHIRVSRAIEGRNLFARLGCCREGRTNYVAFYRGIALNLFRFFPIR